MSNIHPSDGSQQYSHRPRPNLIPTVPRPAGNIQTGPSQGLDAARPMPPNVLRPMAPRPMAQPLNTQQRQPPPPITSSPQNQFIRPRPINPQQATQTPTFRPPPSVTPHVRPMPPPQQQQPLQQPQTIEQQITPNDSCNINSETPAIDVGKRRLYPESSAMGPSSSRILASNTLTSPVQAQNTLGNFNLLNTPLPISDASSVVLDEAYARPILEGNAHPAFQSCTLNAIPRTSQMLAKTRIPFGILINPYPNVLNDHSSSEDARNNLVPTISGPILRCRRCRVYINPFVSFIDSDTRWKCNMCGIVNEIPNTYDYDSVSKEYVDRSTRMELRSSVVEFIAPDEYMVRAPIPNIYLFLIDVSTASINNGMTATIARSILESLDRIPNRLNRAKVGFITFNSCIHCYNFNVNLRSAEPQMIVIPDLKSEDELNLLYLPSLEDLLANITEKRDLIETFLRKLPLLFASSNDAGSCLGPALSAGIQLMAKDGGKIIIASSSIPNTGVGLLKPRDDVNVLGTKKESANLQPGNGHYKKMAVEAAKYQIAVDLFLTPSSYVDIATLDGISRYTGGEVYYYPGFNASLSEDCAKLSEDLFEFLARSLCLEAVLRVRVSRGLAIQAYHGNFFTRTSDLLSLPNVAPGLCYGVQIGYEEGLTGMDRVYFQTALLHTTSYGQRRIRVLNLALPVTDSLSEVYSNVDSYTLFGLLSRMATEKAVTSSLEDARDALVNKVIDIFGSYRSSLMSGSSNVASTGLVISDNLRILPGLVLGLLKNIAFRSGSDTPLDTRSAFLYNLRIMPLHRAIQFILPTFFSLHDLSEEVISGAVKFPQSLQLTSEKLNAKGLFLLFDSFDFYFWVGPNVHPDLLALLFGITSYDELLSGKISLSISLPTNQTPYSRALHRIFETLKKTSFGSGLNPYYIIVKGGSTPSTNDARHGAVRAAFYPKLIEDRISSSDGYSYSQFIGILRDKVNTGSF